MKKVFAMFDQGKTGFVECSKFVNILNTLGQAFDEDELKARIAENDPNSEYSSLLSPTHTCSLARSLFVFKVELLTPRLFVFWQSQSVPVCFDGGVSRCLFPRLTNMPEDTIFLIQITDDIWPYTAMINISKFELDLLGHIAANGVGQCTS